MSIISNIITFDQAAPPGPFDPEAGLTLTSTIAPDTTFGMGAGAGEVDNGQSAVFAADFTGLDGVTDSGGLIMECGGTGIGALCGFKVDGDFYMWCGDGASADPAAQANIAFDEILGTNVHGDGTLVWEWRGDATTPLSVKAWWNGVKVLDNQAADGVWSGGNDGGFLRSGGGSDAGNQSGFVVSVTPPDYTTVSSARYYKGQTVTE